MIDFNKDGSIKFPKGYKKNVYVQRRIDGGMMNIIEDHLNRKPHEYVLLKDAEQMFLEGLLGRKRKLARQRAAAMGLSYEDYCKQTGWDGVKELEEEMAAGKQRLFTGSTPQFKESAIDRIKQQSNDQSAAYNVGQQAAQTFERPEFPTSDLSEEEEEVPDFPQPKMPEIPEMVANQTMAEPVTYTAEDLVINELIESGDVVKSGAWYKYNETNYRKADLITALEGEDHTEE